MDDIFEDVTDDAMRDITRNAEYIRANGDMERGYEVVIGFEIEGYEGEMSIDGIDYTEASALANTVFSESGIGSKREIHSFYQSLADGMKDRPGSEVIGDPVKRGGGTGEIGPGTRGQRNSAWDDTDYREPGREQEATRDIGERLEESTDRMQNIEQGLERIAERIDRLEEEVEGGEGEEDETSYYAEYGRFEGGRSARDTGEQVGKAGVRTRRRLDREERSPGLVERLLNG